MVVNPTSWDVRIELGKRHCDVSSHRVDTTFTIPRMDGRILLPRDEALRAGELAGREWSYRVLITPDAD